MISEYIFWMFVSIIFYNYLGYTIVLAILVVVKNIFSRNRTESKDYTPEVTLVIPAYNEKEYIDNKIKNTNELDYPRDKLKVIWVTDGSDDGTPEKLEREDGIIVMHESTRSGKIGAVNRIMDFIDTPIVVFCDANSILNESCLREIVKPFKDKKVGCVAGEKKIQKAKSDKAVGSGEGMYWKYESFIKKLESKINSTVGAAGELFAIRTALFEKIPGDSVVEDFVISLSIIRKFYRTKYTAKAYSVETASINITEELKRKVRIAYGSIQTLLRYSDLLNPFRYGFFSFQYFSHKVLRWTLVPFLFPLIVICNILIYNTNNHHVVYDVTLFAQILFYMMVCLGFIFKNRRITAGFFFIPFYIIIMNYAVLRGYVRYFFQSQSVAWEKAKRG